MATTPTFVTRTDDASGDSFLTFDVPSGAKAQGVVIIDQNGDQAGVTGTPIVVSVSGSVTVTGTVTANLGTQAAPLTIDSTTPIDVNITTNPVPVTFSSGTLVMYATGASAEASAVLASAAASIHELRVVLDPTAVTLRYMMLFNATSLPVNGTSPAWRGLVPSSGEMSESWPDGLAFATGIVVALSETSDTLTIAPAEAYFHSQRI